MVSSSADFGELFNLWQDITRTYCPSNKDYTTGRPYIEACKFGTQTLSCQQITSICVTWSTPKNTHPLDPSRVPYLPFVYHGMQIHHATRLMREVCALRHLSINTEKSYIHWLGRYGFFLKDPKLTLLTAEKKMEAFLTRLAFTGVAASTQNQAFNALVFVYKKFMGIQLGPLREIARCTERHHPCLSVLRSQIVPQFRPRPHFNLLFRR